jgi:hypothetical protein
MLFPALVIIITLFVTTAFLYIWKRRDEDEGPGAAR